MWGLNHFSLIMGPPLTLWGVEPYFLRLHSCIPVLQPLLERSRGGPIFSLEAGQR